MSSGIIKVLLSRRATTLAEFISEIPHLGETQYSRYFETDSILLFLVDSIISQTYSKIFSET
jgi:hypothetical protein